MHEQGPRAGRSGRRLRLLALMAALGGVGVAGSALAADDIQEAVTASGKVWYDQYCTPCHGPDGGPGKAVNAKTKEPVDLRTYVARNGGKFPASRWLAVLADANPGSPHAEVWERIRKSQQGTTTSDAAARGMVAAIARYVMSVQSP